MAQATGAAEKPRPATESKPAKRSEADEPSAAKPSRWGRLLGLLKRRKKPDETGDTRSIPGLERRQPEAETKAQKRTQTPALKVAAAPSGTPETGTAAKPRKKRRGLVIGLGLIALLAGGGAAYYYSDSQPAETAKPAGRHAQETRPAPAPAKLEPPIFVALETFTVNLNPEERDRYLQASISLKVSDSAVENAIKLYLPEVRSKVLLLLSGKRASELETVEGKQALANEILSTVNQTLTANNARAVSGSVKSTSGAPARPANNGPVTSVFFTSFIIQ